MMFRRRHRDDWDDFAGLGRWVGLLILAAALVFGMGFLAGRKLTPDSAMTAYQEHLLRRASRNE